MVERREGDFGYRGMLGRKVNTTQEQLRLDLRLWAPEAKGLLSVAGPAWLRWDRQGECGKGRAFALLGGQSQQPLGK